MSWYVLHTSSRSEKRTAYLLEKKGIKVYCPTTEVVRQWSDRKKKIQEPVFRSYIFVDLENYEIDRSVVLNTPGVVRFLWWAGRPGIVRLEEIVAIKEFVNDYKATSITVDVREGDTVVIQDGAFKEQTAKLIKIKGDRAYLELKSIGWKMVAQLSVQNLDITYPY